MGDHDDGKLRKKNEGECDNFLFKFLFLFVTCSVEKNDLFFYGFYFRLK